MSVTSITVSDNGISNTIEVSAVTELDRDRLRRFVWAMIAFNGLDVQIERDGQPMNLCATPGCPMLVEVRGDTCPRCLDPDPYGMNCAIGPCHECEPLTRAKCLNDNGN